jgi:hypothetical protein
MVNLKHFIYYTHLISFLNLFMYNKKKNFFIEFIFNLERK